MEKEEKDRIIQRLIEKGAKAPCPRCHNSEFALIDGYFNQSIQSKLNGLYMGGPTVPSIVTVCTKCGFVSQHALGALGLLPQKEESKNG